MVHNKWECPPPLNYVHTHMSMAIAWAIHRCFHVSRVPSKTWQVDPDFPLNIYY